MSRAVRIVGSPKLTPVGIVVLAVAVAVSYRVPESPTWLMLPPLAP